MSVGLSVCRSVGRIFLDNSTEASNPRAPLLKVVRYSPSKRPELIVHLRLFFFEGFPNAMWPFPVPIKASDKVHKYLKQI